MPLGKYYCDYCDKQFRDTPGARWRHLQGLSHKRAKAQWYDAVGTSTHSLGTAATGVCNHFVRTGSCQYGDSCRYYHPKKNMPNPDIKAQGTEGNSNFQSHDNSCGVSQGESSLPGVMFGNQMGTSLRNLPPSLWPPPEGGYPPLSFIDWG